jgi:1-deoxy-D-xylulose-5-phosphate synthase
MDEIDLRNLMYTAQLAETNKPFSIRYPRGCGIKPNWKKPFEKIEIGTGRKLTDGNDLAILTIGKPGIFAQRAVKSLAVKVVSAAHYDMRFVKPLDTRLLSEVFEKFDKIVTVEDGVIQAGLEARYSNLWPQMDILPNSKCWESPINLSNTEHSKICTGNVILIRKE